MPIEPGHGLYLPIGPGDGLDLPIEPGHGLYLPIELGRGRRCCRLPCRTRGRAREEARSGACVCSFSERVRTSSVGGAVQDAGAGGRAVGEEGKRALHAGVNSLFVRARVLAPEATARCVMKGAGRRLAVFTPDATARHPPPPLRDHRQNPLLPEWPLPDTPAPRRPP